MDKKSIKIDTIGLSSRTHNALRRAGVETVGDLIGHTEESLSLIKNMGKKSVLEALQKIEECKKSVSEGETPSENTNEDKVLPPVTDDITLLIESDEGKDFVKDWIKENNIMISGLDMLSGRAYNCLILSGYIRFEQIAFLSFDELMLIPRMDEISAKEIRYCSDSFLKKNASEIISCLEQKHEMVLEKEPDIYSCFYDDDNREKILQYIRANDIDTELLDLSVRAKNVLQRNGMNKVSDFVFVSDYEIGRFKNLGQKTKEEIRSFINDYIAKNEVQLKAFLDGGESVVWSEDVVKDIVIKIFNGMGFDGLSLYELMDRPEMPEQVSEQMLKKVLGKLIEEGTLEYVDFRCYRVYPKFIDYLSKCDDVDEKNKSIVKQRLMGNTLQSVADENGLTRERVRQIVNKTVEKVKNSYFSKTGSAFFDEDYYLYFFKTYEIDKSDAIQWLGISEDTIGYLSLTKWNDKKRDLHEAVEDSENLDYGFRLKIKNYLNRNKLFLDGKWIEKKRADLEEYVVCKYCKDSVSFDDFVDIYNNFLREEEVEYSENLYCTEGVIHTRRNHLSEERYLLWKYGEVIRYYDIDSRDYSELLEVLNLDAFTNIIISTAKFMEEFPEIMEKYDIRDHYELHNLLRKIIPDGSYNNFKCTRTPNIEFGTFDRNQALLNMLIDNSPISQENFVRLIHEQYGYDSLTITGTYLQPLKMYYDQGVYTIEQKVMDLHHMEVLKKELTEDFYYIDEIRNKYLEIFPEADVEEVNPYNLISMGFSILTNYAYKNYNSLDEYFRYILTRDDIADISGIKKRFASTSTFNTTYTNLKNEKVIFEYDHNQIINFRKLEKAGITMDDLYAFCDEVYDFVEDGQYFSLKSIKREGFDSSLFELGFSDWFYSGLLKTDDRFSYSNMFGNVVLFKGDEKITIKSFEEMLIKKHQSIDLYDLMTEMEEVYGCRIHDRSDLMYKVKDSDVYYDEYLDRFYANTRIFEQELEKTEGLKNEFISRKERESSERSEETS